MNPTLYDVLGVPRDASPDRIKRAWRESAEKFEPGAGGSGAQFRLFNEAAEVLLDPARRAAYDEQLVEASGVSPAAAGERPAAAAAPDAPIPGAAAATATLPLTEEEGVSRRSQARSSTDVGGSSTDDGVEGEGVSRRSQARSSTDVGGSSTDRGRGVSWLVLGVLGLLAAAAVGVAAYLFFEANEAEAHQDALNRAPAAAERAAVAVLSYDHESIDADVEAAAAFLSEDYRSDYVDTMTEVVKEQAVKTKAVVEAEVLASSAMATSGDSDEVQVLLYVNQTTTSATNSEPSVAVNRVRLDMVQVDGTWLVDGITSY